jgi:ABC-type branched-subunit amino acid transport system substrate-binding protein
MNRLSRYLTGLLAIAGAALTLTIAACGSSAQDSAAPITLMTITAVGSPIESFPEIQPDVQAAVNAINKAGGVNGVKVQDIFCNTEANVDQALSCAREAVQDKVVAVVGENDNYDTQTTPILAAAGIPDVGVWSSGATVDYTSNDSFPLTAGGWASYSATIFGMHDLGLKRFAIASIDLPIGLTQAAVAEAAGKSLGMKFEGIVKIPAEGVSDYSPYAEQLKELGAQGVLAILGQAQYQGIVNADASIGYSPQLGSCVTCGESSPGLLMGSPFPAATDPSNPGIAEFLKERNASGLPALKQSDYNTYSGLNAWLAVHAVADVAATIKKGQVTAQTLTNSLRLTKNLMVENMLVFDPASYGSKALGQFADFPTYANYLLRVGAGGAIDSTILPPVPDPIKAARQ